MSFALCFVLVSCGGEKDTSAYVLEANATVSKSVDGDTIEVKMGSQTERVRLIGVDTPETVHPSKPVECFGKEASAFTKKVLPKDTDVHLVLDAEERDVYGRVLAYVYRADNGMFVNAELVSQGYANVLTIAPNVAHTSDFVALAAEARKQDRGLWASCPAGE